MPVAENAPDTGMPFMSCLPEKIVCETGVVVLKVLLNIYRVDGSFSLVTGTGPVSTKDLCS